LMADYAAMDAWLVSNPSKAKKNQGRFATNWLSREKKKPSSGGMPSAEEMDRLIFGGSESCPRLY
jgi:hypothetical protein